SPTLYLMVQHRQAFDAAWIMLTRIRSADHSFPSSWWQAGSPDIPRFLLLLGLAAISLSFPARARQQRKTLLLAAAGGILFLLGYLFTEIWPVPLVMRAQLFRASRLLLILGFVHVAHGLAAAWRLPLRPYLPKWRAVLEFGVACATFATVAIPSLLPFLP